MPFGAWKERRTAPFARAQDGRGLRPEFGGTAFKRVYLLVGARKVKGGPHPRLEVWRQVCGNERARNFRIKGALRERWRALGRLVRHEIAAATKWHLALVERGGAQGESVACGVGSKRGAQFWFMRVGMESHLVVVHDFHKLGMLRLMTARPAKRQRLAEPGELGELLRWLRAQGAEGLDELEFRASSVGGGSGLGVFSRGGVKPGGRVALIPQSWYAGRRTVSIRSVESLPTFPSIFFYFVFSLFRFSFF